MNFTSTPEGALIASCALGALMVALIFWRTAQGARARAAEKARIWGELKRSELEARAARKRAMRASGAQMRARIRGALMIAVGAVALGATNLSAHGSIAMIGRAGLHSLDAQISVIVVFEMFLAILGALSYWHMHHGIGWNKYEAGVWLMASLMGAVSWWGAGNLIFALWPVLAAVAWHMVITFGREHKTSALVVWWRLKRGKATSRDANVVLIERMLTRIANHAFAAHRGARVLRKARARAWQRAWAEADALGILTEEVRARIQTRVAALFAGVDALSPEAVAHMNPWSARTVNTRAARIARPVSAPPAPAPVESAHVPDDARALTEESAPARTAPRIAHSKEDLLAAIDEHFGSRDSSRIEWAKTFVETNGILPTRNDLARAFSMSPGNCAKWIAPVNKALKA